MRRYCDYCHDEEDVKIIAKDEVYPVHDDKIPVKARVMVCMNCGNELYCRELDSQTLNKVLDTYRRKHNYKNERRDIR